MSKTEDRAALVVRRHDEGATFKVIAQELGVSPGRANQIYRDHFRRGRGQLIARIAELATASARAHQIVEVYEPEVAKAKQVLADLDGPLRQVRRALAEYEADMERRKLLAPNGGNVTEATDRARER